VRDVADVKRLIGSKAAQIVDARAAARFEGSVPEPRAGLRSATSQARATCPSPHCSRPTAR
jgi:thiosulfate/3-mercaptopyruvate sulfurtransferase